jgi:hypothetical protein
MFIHKYLQAYFSVLSNNFLLPDSCGYETKKGVKLKHLFTVMVEHIAPQIMLIIKILYSIGT